MGDNDFIIGRHDGAIKQLLEDNRTILAEVSEIKQTLAAEAGGRKVIAFAWGSIGGVGGALAALKFFTTAVLGKHA